MAISIVGGITLGNDAGAAGTTVAALRSGIATGNLLVCWASWASNGGTATTATVSDPVNGAWTAIGVPQLDATAAQYLAQFYLPATAAVAGALTVTATIGASTTEKTIQILEITGQSTTAPIVKHLENATTSATPTLNYSGANAINKLPSLIVGMFQHASGSLTAGGAGAVIGPGDATSGVSAIMQRSPDIVNLTLGAFGIAVTASSSSWHGCSVCFAENGATLFKLIQKGSTVAKLVLKSTSKNFAVTSTATITRSNNVAHAVTAACAGIAALFNTVGKTIQVSCTGAASRSNNVGKTIQRSCAAAAARLNEIGKTISVACLATPLRLNNIGKTIQAVCTVVATRLNNVGKAIQVACAVTSSRLNSIGKTIQVACSVTALRLNVLAINIIVACLATPLRLNNIGKTIQAVCTVVATRLGKFKFLQRLSELAQTARVYYQTQSASLKDFAQDALARFRTQSARDRRDE